MKGKAIARDCARQLEEFRKSKGLDVDLRPIRTDHHASSSKSQDPADIQKLGASPISNSGVYATPAKSPALAMTGPTSLDTDFDTACATPEPSLLDLAKYDVPTLFAIVKSQQMVIANQARQIEAMRNQLSASRGG